VLRFEKYHNAEKYPAELIRPSSLPREQRQQSPRLRLASLAQAAKIFGDSVRRQLPLTPAAMNPDRPRNRLSAPVFSVVDRDQTRKAYLARAGMAFGMNLTPKTPSTQTARSLDVPPRRLLSAQVLHRCEPAHPRRSAEPAVQPSRQTIHQISRPYRTFHAHALPWIREVPPEWNLLSACRACQDSISCQGHQSSTR
jgi:hypothetical protein